LLPSLYRLYLPLAIAHDLHQVKTGRYDLLVYDSNILRGMIVTAEKGDIEPEYVVDLYARKVLSKVGHILFVVIDTDPQEAIKRWIVRDEVELSEKDKQEEIKGRIQAQKAADIILNSLITLENVKILRLSGSNTPDTNALLVTREVQKRS